MGEYPEKKIVRVSAEVGVKITFTEKRLAGALKVLERTIGEALIDLAGKDPCVNGLGIIQAQGTKVDTLAARLDMLYEIRRSIRSGGRDHGKI